MRRLFPVLGPLMLAACMDPVTSDAQRPTDLPRLAVDGDGRCYARESTPAVIETVTEQIIVQPADLNSDGSVRSPAVYRTVTRQSILRERREIEFETPCPATLTPDFVSSLQRALKARGLYRGPVSGVLDGRTGRAVRAFQRDFGPDSATLSIQAARRLGLVALSRAQIDAASQ